MEYVKILIVDDEIDTMEAMRNNFERFPKCKVWTAATGKEAVEKIKSYSFDLVILDMKLPDISGLDVVKRVKGEKLLPDTIIVTALDSMEIVEEAIKEGVLECIAKPVELETLRMKVKDVLGKKGMSLD